MNYKTDQPANLFSILIAVLFILFYNIIDNFYK